MVAPLLIVAGLGIAAALGLAGGTMLVKPPISETKKEAMVTEVTHAPYETFQYAPQVTTTELYAPTISEVYAPQVSYAPISVIESPYAAIESKKALTQEVEAEAVSRPAVSQMPYQQVPFTVQQPITPTQTQPTTTIGGDVTTLMVLGLVGLGAVVLLTR